QIQASARPLTVTQPGSSSLALSAPVLSASVSQRAVTQGAPQISSKPALSISIGAPKPFPPVASAASTQPPAPANVTLNAPASKKSMDALEALPLSFEENDGQTNSLVKFLTRGRGYTLFLTQKDSVLALRPSFAEAMCAGGATEARLLALRAKTGLNC